MKAKTVIIPIETKVREFHSKLLLSCVLAERGCRVILGGALPIRGGLPVWPTGLFLDKSVSPSRARLFGEYKQWGHKIIAWCEEGLTIVDPNEYLPRKIDAEALRQVERFFAWGPYQADLIRGKCPDSRDKIILTGNPRIDLLRKPFRAVFEEEVQKLKERCGRYALINTNFSLCNHQKGEGAFMRLQKEAGKLKTPEDEAFARGWVAHKTAIFEAFKAFIPKLCRQLPDIKIIIRPHPSENHATWQKLAEAFENCLVVHEGTVVPWILGSDVLIHNGCTTGIEAYLLDKPVLAYQPATSAVYDAELPNRSSEQVFSEEQLLRRAVQIVRDRQDPLRTPEQEAFVAQYISRTAGEYATDCIASVIEDVLACPDRRGLFEALQTRLRRILWRLKNPRGFVPGAGVYHKQKFPGLSEDEVIQAIGLLKNCSGRFFGVRVRGLGCDCFLLQGEKS